jgi:hypothetical protein
MTEAQADARDTPVSPASRPLLMLAADHRSSLERDLYGLTAAPTPEQAAWISADKMLIYQALLDAVPELPASKFGTASAANVPGGMAPDLVWSVDAAAGLPGTADSVGS